MEVIPFVHEGLGNSSYLTGTGDGRAALLDPDRTVGRYIEAAASRGWRIEAVLETHLHADFVSGALDVARATEARLFVSAGAKVHFPHVAVAASERLQIDGAEVEAVASPGHTPEHLSYVFRTAVGPPALFSGGSLIVGGAARTDLIGPDMTESLTRAQFHTLRRAFSHLPDEMLLYPTHGGGSFCSAGGGGERTSTLGSERVGNPLLAIADEEEFVGFFPSTFPAAPDYFFRMRPINQAGPRPGADVPPPPPLSAVEFDRARGEAIVVDVRPSRLFARAHVPGSLNIPFRDVYATWLGWLVPPDATLLFVLGDAPIDRVMDETLLVGYEQFAGRLEGGIEAWQGAGLPVESVALIDVAAASHAIRDGALAVDVRERDDYAAGHIEGALHIPLGRLQAEMGRIPAAQPVVTYCAHGDRSSSAASILERAGRGPVLNLRGGFSAWQKAEVPQA